MMDDQKAADTLREQIALLHAHGIRLKGKAVRYKEDTIARTMADLEWTINKDKRDLLVAISRGKTVQPS